jgi:hypothetical protein
MIRLADIRLADRTDPTKICGNPRSESVQN